MGPINIKSVFGSENGSVPNKLQVFAWTNIAQDSSCHMAPLGHI